MIAVIKMSLCGMPRQFRCVVKLALCGMVVVLATSVLTAAPALAVDNYQPGVIDRSVTTVPAIPEPYLLNNKPATEEPVRDLPRPPVLATETSLQPVMNSLQKVVFEGSTALDQNALQALVEPFLNKPLTSQDLAALKYRVSQAFFKQGYVLTRIVTPPQDLSGGTLLIQVYESRVDDITLNQDSAIRPFVVRAITSQVPQGTVFEETQVESMVNDLNDLHGAKAQASLRPGGQLSTTDIDLTVGKDTETTPNYVSVNNYGSKLTGRNVGTAHLEHGNVLGLGEGYSLDLRRSDDKLWAYGVGVTTPIGYRNMMLGANYVRSANDIGERLEALGASGKTESGDVNLSSKLVNTRNKQIAVSGGVEIREHASFLDKVADKKDNIRRAYVSSSYLLREEDRVLYTTFRLSRGIDVFGASDNTDTDITRSSGKNGAWIFQPAVIANYRVTSWGLDGVMKAYATGQLSSSTLLSSDLFTIGGFGGVRGFEPAQETGEAGYQFSLEYNEIFNTPIPGWQVSAGPFFDGGAVYNRVVGSVDDNHLYSLGLGAETSGKISPRIGKTTFRLDWAVPVGGYASDEVVGQMLYASIMQDF